MLEYLLVSLLSVTTLSVCSFHMLVYPLQRKSFLFIFTLLFFITFFLNAPLGQWVTVFTLLTLFGLIFLFDREHGLLNLSSAVFGYVFMVVLNHVALFAVTKFFHITQLELVEKYSLHFSLFFLLLAFASTYPLGKQTRSHIKHLTLPPKMGVFITLHLLFCAAMFVSNFIYGETLGYPPQIVAMNAFFFGAFFFFTSILLFFIVTSLQKEYKAKLELQNYEAMKHYTEQLEDVYQETRAFRHDYTNTLCSLYSYIQEGDMDGLKTYYQQQLLPQNQNFESSNYMIGKLSAIQIPELKGLIYVKMVSALRKDIQVVINIPHPLSQVSIPTADLSRILGIFLDNAIESSLLTEKKVIELRIEPENNRTSITLINSCTEIPFSITQLSEKGVSTKGENRGLGLYTVAQILANHSHVFRSTEEKNHYFIQKLQNL